MPTLQAMKTCEKSPALAVAGAPCARQRHILAQLHPTSPRFSVRAPHAHAPPIDAGFEVIVRYFDRDELFV